MSRYVLCGGSGAIGSALATSLVNDGQEVIVVSRHPAGYHGPGRAVRWDDLASVLDGAKAVANFAGTPVAVRWNKANRQAIVQSRVESVHALAKALATCARPPAAWVQASAVGIYGDREDEILDDTAGPPAPGSRQENFLAQTCRQWEAAAHETSIEGIRQVIVRIGIVMQADAGAGPVLLRLAKFGLGGRAGDGRQWVPWIDARDMTRLLRFVLDDDRCEGIINAVGPNPATNADLMAAFRQVAGRRLGLPAPAWGLGLGRKLIGLPDEAALASTRVVPRRLESIGFAFEHTSLKETADNIAAGR